MTLHTARLAATVLLAIGIVCAAGCSGTPAPAPVREVPPSALNASVTPDNVQSTVCVPAFVAAQQPSAVVNAETERRLLQQQGIDVDAGSTYALRPIIPAALGGNLRAPNNLQLLQFRGERSEARKAALEQRLQALVCSSKVGLREAQAALWNDWLAAYGQYVPAGDR